MDKKRLVDPVHFFDERGHALSNYDVLVRENAALKARNERLEAALRAVKRQRVDELADTTPITHH